MQEPLRLESRAAVAQMLARALEGRAPATVRLAQVTDIYSSMLLEADFPAGHLVFDELHPADGNSALKPGSELIVQVRVEGGHIEFRSNIVEAVQHGGNAAWRTSIPQVVLHHERRFAYRLMIPASLSLSSTLFDTGGAAQRAKLVDISRLGAGTLMSGKLEADIGSSVPCVFDLPELRLATDVQIRSIRKNASGQTRLGLMFSNLAPTKRHNVERAVTSIERALLRQHVKVR